MQRTYQNPYELQQFPSPLPRHVYPFLPPQLLSGEGLFCGAAGGGGGCSGGGIVGGGEGLSPGNPLFGLKNVMAFPGSGGVVWSGTLQIALGALGSLHLDLYSALAAPEELLKYALTYENCIFASFAGGPALQPGSPLLQWLRMSPPARYGTPTLVS